MSIFMGAMGGAGEALGNVGSTMLKSELDRDNQAQGRQQESDLALQRAKTLEAFKQDLQNAPLNRLGAKAQELAGQDVPQEPKRVTSLPAYDPADKSGPAHFHGDLSIVQRAVQNLPEPDRSAALAQLQGEVAGQQQVEADAVAGKTRKRTPDEALGAAVEDAKVNDLPALAQYEREVGKPKRDERRIDVQQEREDNRATAAATAEERKALADARRYEADMKRLDLQGGALEANNRKIDAWIENEAAKRESDEKKAANPKTGAAERMSSIVNAMNASIRDMDANRPGTKASAEEKEAWQLQRSNAVAVRARAMNKLNSNFDDAGVDQPAPGPGAPPPNQGALPPTLPSGSRKIGTSGGKPVYETPDGKRFIAQ